jgi:hypothetical protein
MRGNERQRTLAHDHHMHTPLQFDAKVITRNRGIGAIYRWRCFKAAHAIERTTFSNPFRLSDEKRTLELGREMSALCQKRTLCAAAKCPQKSEMYSVCWVNNRYFERAFTGSLTLSTLAISTLRA